MSSKLKKRANNVPYGSECNFETPSLTRNKTNEKFFYLTGLKDEVEISDKLGDIKTCFLAAITSITPGIMRTE